MTATVFVPDCLRMLSDVAFSPFSWLTLRTSAVESVDDGILRNLDKNHTGRDFDHAVALTHAAGIAPAARALSGTGAQETSARHRRRLDAAREQLPQGGHGLERHVSQAAKHPLLPGGAFLLGEERVGPPGIDWITRAAARENPTVPLSR